MDNLKKLGDIRIIEESMAHYSVIGHRLLNNKQEDRIKDIERSKPTTRERMEEVYRIWLHEDKNHSWVTLCECFRTCKAAGLDPLARKIEIHLGVTTLLTDGKRSM